jgi:hypothetical protein
MSNDPKNVGFEDKNGVALLGRRKGGFLEVLAFDVEDGKVLCLFETQDLADAFSKLNPEIRGRGWRVHVITTDKLPDLIEDFDYVTINPSPQLNSTKELITALGFARSLRRDDVLGMD